MKKWIDVRERVPDKEGYYRCICRGFGNVLRCKFIKEKKGEHVRGWRQWSAPHFIYKKRAPFAIFWREIR